MPPSAKPMEGAKDGATPRASNPAGKEGKAKPFQQRRQHQCSHQLGSVGKACACSTGSGTNGEHCSGHGTCEADCVGPTCSDAKCVCEDGWIGDKCEMKTINLVEAVPIVF